MLKKRGTWPESADRILAHRHAALMTNREPKPFTLTVKEFRELLAYGKEYMDLAEYYRWCDAPTAPKPPQFLGVKLIVVDV